MSTLSLPEEEPPVPQAVSSAPTPGSPTSPVPFTEVLDEMQALHQRLLEAHHHELARASTAGSPTDRSGAAPAAPAAVPTSPSLAPSASALSVSHSASKKHVNSKKSVILNLPAAAAENVTHEKSEKSVSIALGPAGDSASPRSVESHVESRVRSVQSGLSEESLSPRSTRVSSRLMKQAREVAVNIEHQVDEDRAEPEGGRMSIGSRRSLKSAVKRQYLVRTEREDYRMTFLKTKFGSLIQPVLTVTVIIGLSVHVLGSLWYYVGDVDGGWVLKEGLHEVSIARQYTRSMEWALSKLPPSALRVSVELHTPAERWLGIFGTGMALLCGSIFVSFLTNTMADVARERRRSRDVGARKEMNSHMPLLEDLPEGMVRELFQEGRTQTLHNHAFFMETWKNSEQTLLFVVWKAASRGPSGRMHAIRTKEIGLADSAMELNLCSHAVSELYLLAGDIIFDTTSKTEGMYLIGAGNSIYFYWSESTKMSARRSRRTETTGSIFQSIMTLGTSGPTNTNQRDRSSTMLMAQTMIQAGEYCAEPALWSRALLVSTCELFKVLEHYANSLANTIVYARCFVEELNKTADLCKQVTDLPLMLGFTIDRHIDRLLMRRPHRPLDIVSVLLFRFFGRR
eukprot:g7518.t1